MKKLLITVLEYANIKFDKAAIEANDNIVVSEENFNAIKASLEEAKGFKEKLEAANQDATAAAEKVKALEASLATAEAAQKKAEDALAAANTTIEEKDAEIAKLGAKPGASKTGAPKEEGDGVEGGEIAGLPEWANQEEPIYQLLAEIDNKHRSNN